ncbi:MAG: DUF6629 family protein [Hyphomicrobiaceae bacterium]
MCFSAPASFAAAAVTGMIGIACVAKSGRLREMPLAAMPLLFAAQQIVEGVLWLTLPVAPDGAEASLLTLVFLLYAKVLWPVYAPLSVALLEADAWRRRLMWAIVVSGAAVGGYFLPSIIRQDHSASILGGHIAYAGPELVPSWIAVSYFLSTCVALLLSSVGAIRVLGLLVTVGAAITYAFYWDAFTSVWCFFAAAASIVLYSHFAAQARSRTMASA